LFKISVIAAALFATGQATMAQPVGGGGYIQQIPPRPEAPKRAPDIRLPTTPPPVDAIGEVGGRVQVNSLRITGHTLFTEAQLVAATGFAPGQQMDMAQLRAAAARITAFYNRRGYFVAQAYLPPQDVKEGAVTIAVVEGRYGAISLNNNTRLRGRVARGILGDLDSGDPVASAPLERRLLLLSDIPGIELKSTLTPGASVGSSDLVIELTPGRMLTGSLEADNGGNRYTGEVRLGGSLDFNNPTGLGDLVSLRVLTSGSGLRYLRGAYEVPVGSVVVGVSYADVDYRLGKEFSALKARGSAQIASIYGDYPLIRSHDSNLSLLADLTAKRYEDRVGATASVVDREAVAFTLGLRGDRRDSFLSGGWSSYSLAVTTGRIDIRTASALAIDRATARSDGQYAKVAFAADRLQALGGPFSLYGSIRGQAASKNLDISEKMQLGGAFGVRAYPEGEGYGDRGYLATIEGRWLLPQPTFGGRVRLIAFIDAGQVQIAEDPYFVGRNRLSRSGAGVGAIWADSNNLQLRASYAHRLGSERAISGGDSSGRFWVQLVKLF